MTLLGAQTVTDYLVKRGVIESAAGVRVQALGGGVSNVVLAVDGPGRSVVVKQALPRLRVADVWLAPPERALAEARALAHVGSLVPERVPAVVDADPELCTLVIERAPDGWKDWKSTLLSGVVDPEIARAVGSTVGSIHAATAGDPRLDELGSWASFEQLRLEPFHATVAARRPDLAPALEALSARMAARRRCLVHGDCSPKNVLAGADGMWLIDFEVVHRGDPTFDVAFMLCHLVCKAIAAPARHARLRAAAAAFVDAHGAAAGDLLDDPTWVVRHTGALVAARVDGKSPVGYFDADHRARARALAARWLTGPDRDLDQLWDDLGAPG